MVDASVLTAVEENKIDASVLKAAANANNGIGGYLSPGSTAQQTDF